MNTVTVVDTTQPNTPLKDDYVSESELKKQIDVQAASDGSATVDVSVSHARALLPKNTLVRIVGNARTSPKLIGVEGHVRRAMGLGGWHWIAVPDGREVKIQRNALMVLKMPDYEEEESESEDPVPPPVPNNTRPQRCVPSRTFCPRQSLRHSNGYGSGLGLEGIPAPQQRCDGSDAGRVNLGHLETPTLKRYCTAHGLHINANAPRNKVLCTAHDHFSCVEIKEIDVIRRVIAVSGMARSAEMTSSYW